jgi:GTP-binding protein
VAYFPFSTLHPQLGVVRIVDSSASSGADQSFVLADVPGLIEGAAEGAGLGHQFLRHLARTRLLLHVIDVAPLDDAVDPVRAARAVVAELAKYDPALHRKPRWVVFNKVDLLPPQERAARLAELRRRLRLRRPSYAISAATGEGCRELMWAVQNFVAGGDAAAAALAQPDLPGDRERLQHQRGATGARSGDRAA